MIRVLLISLCFSLCFSRSIVGYGGTFSDMLINEATKSFESSTGNRVEYKSIGSLGAIKQLMLKKSDFAVSDINSTYENCITKPLLSGNIAISYNLDGVSKLNLTPEIISMIYQGEIKFWDDDLIKKANPDLELVHEKINIFHRYDGSGTTLNFTKFLQQNSNSWMLGFGEYMDFKVGVGKKGGPELAKFIDKTPNSIGYVGYLDANATGLKNANIVINGKIYSPEDESYPLKNYTYFIYPEGNKNSEKFLKFIYDNVDTFTSSKFFNF
ncbi:phosphate ABC transporter substrate-binding protein PstS [Campylobacter corcagiensis]|uniref:Phosphate ABC transporter substrate-binding protein PstS n=1 Tax=Campylobacter corcagiensis TaxID=1448857 RepID=A0A7M1LDU6_9BACT|nr:phosphate ABC transporter substrate-binding protein PstS [Campylobacter corcagiensis]QOQ86752.1 phosphate ABC transporter substrate-binding protein PstS [Campylobacter corcagiensis]